MIEDGEDIVNLLLRMRGCLKRARTANSVFEGRLSQASVKAGRVLLSVMLVLISVMPLTEYLWHFDQFLHGGYDFELGLLAVASIFCLAVVLVQQGRLDLAVAFVLQRLYSVLKRAGLRMYTWSREHVPLLYSAPSGSSSLGIYTLPLRV